MSENVFSQYVYKTLPTHSHLWMFKKTFCKHMALSGARPLLLLLLLLLSLSLLPWRLLPGLCAFLPTQPARGRGGVGGWRRANQLRRGPAAARPL